MQDTIGIDVSKEGLDAYRLSDRSHRRFANDRAGLKALIRWIGGDSPALAVFEASTPSSNAAMTSACRASMRRERMSPPCGFGAKLPVARRAASQRITEDTDTPKRAAAARRLIPLSTAASARARRSTDSGLPI